MAKNKEDEDNINQILEDLPNPWDNMDLPEKKTHALRFYYTKLQV